MTQVFHGGGIDEAVLNYGGERENWLDLSTGINPNAYPVPHFDDSIWQQLPDKEAEANLLNAARQYYGVLDINDITAGNGTQAIMEVLPWIIKPAHVAIISPTYAEHANIWQKANVPIFNVEDLDMLPENLDTLVVVNPNNPDARIWSVEELTSLAKKVKHLIVDEAFCDAYPESSLIPLMTNNVIVLRSFGKFFGLAGLRLGFAIGNKLHIAKLRECLGPWSVSGPALKIGCEAMLDSKWIMDTRDDLNERSEQLAELLQENELEVRGANALFVYVKSDKAQSLFKHFAEQHILVRPFHEMPEYLRFGLCKNDKEFGRLKEALSSFV